MYNPQYVEVESLASWAVDDNVCVLFLLMYNPLPYIWVQGHLMLIYVYYFR